MKKLKKDSSEFFRLYNLFLISKETVDLGSFKNLLDFSILKLFNFYAMLSTLTTLCGSDIQQLTVFYN